VTPHSSCPDKITHHPHSSVRHHALRYIHRTLRSPSSTMSASTIRRLLLTRNLHIPSCKPILPAPLDKQPRIPITDYSSIPLQQLRRELYHRSLPTKGVKEYVRNAISTSRGAADRLKQIIYRLEQHDKKHGRKPSICTSPRMIKGKITLKAKKRYALNSTHSPPSPTG